MSDRAYRAVLGFFILLGLYFEIALLMYVLIALLIVEGATNLRLAVLVCRLRNCVTHGNYQYVNHEEVASPRFSMDAEQVWRLVVGGLLYLSYVQFDMFWFFPWFMGLAIFGSGLSGVCPGILVMRWIGFR